METDGISGRGNKWNVEMGAMDGMCRDVGLNG
jgi:hypothetical protein